MRSSKLSRRCGRSLPALLLLIGLVSVGAVLPARSAQAGWVAEKAGRSEEAEEEDWEQVISRLTKEVRRWPDRDDARKQLAVAHNNFAVDLAGKQQWELATYHLTEAIELNGADGQFQVNLAGVYLSRAYQEFSEHQLDRARVSVGKALDIDPNLVNAHALLGEIEYNSQHLKKAQGAWERTLELEPAHPDVTRRLKKLNQELPIESTFGRISQTYFDLRYEGVAYRPMGWDIRSALLAARRVVGSDFAYWPKSKLVVLVYTSESFRAVRSETPEWLAGSYDGKIRMPLPSDEFDLDTVKKILFHEYTHAIVYDMTRGRCPIWFNEGLAEYEGARHGERRSAQLAAAVDRDQLIPWEELSDQFSMDRSAEEVSLAYQQSHSIVRYLIERYGFWRIRRVLKAVGAGAELDDVLADEFHVRFARLQNRWRQWLPRFLNDRS